MSTVDSQLLVASTALVEDVVRPVWKNLDERRTLMLSRVAVVAVAVVGAWIATDPESRVFELAAYAWAGLGASFGPAVLACVLWRRTTEAGVVAGMLTGAVVTVLWKGLSGGPWDIFELYEIVPAFAAGCLAITVVSLAGGRAGDRPGSIFDRLVDHE